MKKKLGLWLALFVALIAWHRNEAALGDTSAELFRRPVALTLSNNGRLLYAANERSGSLSILDIEKQQVIDEISVGQRLSDLVKIPKSNLLLATDEAAHELILLNTDGDRPGVVSKVGVSPYPVSVVVSADGQRCYVASLWSRRLTVLGLSIENEVKASVIATVDLPFAPRQQLLVRDDTHLIIADSFGGHLATYDVKQDRLIGVREFPGHNIRGLGVNADESMLLVSHQMLNELAHTVRNDVHWGLLMSNDLRWLRLDAVMKPDADLYKGAHMHPLGEAGSATADPNELCVAENGTVVVALGGVGEVAIGKEKDFSLYRIKVGRRPTAVVVTDDSRRAFVANTFDDSVSILDLEKREAVTEISLGPQPELSLADRGERLFFDGSLSHDGWMSCHSCHTNGHTNGLLNDNFSDRSFGAPKRVLSLLGRKDTAPFAWNADAPDLVTQIRKSIQVTMQSDEAPLDGDVAALAAFVEALETPPSIDVARAQRDEAAIQRGTQLFNALDCARCHRPPSYTTPATYDVGLVDKLGNDMYNPPSLLGVGQRGPYFHDNRAATLKAVFDEFSHQVERELTADELLDLLAFLRNL